MRVTHREAAEQFASWPGCLQRLNRFLKRSQRRRATLRRLEHRLRPAGYGDALRSELRRNICKQADISMPVHCRDVALRITPDSEATLFEAYGTREAVFRDGIQKKQIFVGLAVAAGIGDVARVPQKLTECDGALRSALERAIHTNRDHHGAQIGKLRVRLDHSGDHMAANDLIGPRYETIEAGGKRVGALLRRDCASEQQTQQTEEKAGPDSHCAPIISVSKL